MIQGFSHSGVQFGQTKSEWAARMAQAIQDDMAAQGIRSLQTVTLLPNEIFDIDAFREKVADGQIRSIELNHDSLKVQIAYPELGHTLENCSPAMVMTELENGDYPEKLMKAMAKITALAGPADSNAL